MTDTSDPETGFLEALGQRVRTMRGLAGMSRKVLAKVSGISERYIAQLESGKGNVSIVLLRRVSNAMGAHLEDLIPSAEPAPDWAVIRDLLRKATPAQIAQAKDALAGGGHSMQRRSSFSGIALIGLRGAGKSTLGALLADAMELPFVELSREIEKVAGCSIREIHDLYGTAAYRRYERRALDVVVKAHPAVVIATPGGIVAEPATFNELLAHCTTIWLQASPEEHMGRVAAQGDTRPMAASREAMDDLRRILDGRAAFYSKADATLDTGGRTVAQSFAALTRLVAEVAGMHETARSA